MSDIGELIARIEKATGPSLVLDGEIWCAVNGYEFVMWDGAGCVYRPAGKPGARSVRHEPARSVRPYTASLDAAVALVERELPGAFWLISKGKMSAAEPEYGAQLLFGHDQILGEGEGATAGIALLLALLRFLPEKEPG